MYAVVVREAGDAAQIDGQGGDELGHISSCLRVLSGNSVPKL